MEDEVPRQSCHSEALSACLNVLGHCISIVLLDDLKEGNLHTGKGRIPIDKLHAVFIQPLRENHGTFVTLSEQCGSQP